MTYDERILTHDETIRLEAIRFQALRIIDLSLIGSMNDDRTIEFAAASELGNAYSFMLRQIIMGKTLQELNIKYPANWKEAVKERFAPRWFLKRHPVRYVCHEVKASALYPMIKRTPGQPTVIHIADTTWTGAR